ncbi:MAG: M23 family metallopeptidase [Flammeovirgaceae bacterium]|nr:M23 family metallopeptidase [Flammeovirgaceae bacterium]
MKSSRVGIFLLIFFYSVAYGQFSEPDGFIADRTYTELDYLFPINPGKENTLAGTFGELRSNHFHSGIDVRTGGQIGLPVLASQDGWISRAIIGPGGFGTALYVTHRNGQMTVYGHLDKINGALGKHMLNEQYRKKSFDVELFFKAGQFNVKRGDTIALSGNSGSSNGPHLHYDIRGKDGRALNPLQFGFTEVIDNIPPHAQKVALKTLDINSRINGQFGRFEFYLSKSGSDYILPYPILAYGKIGVEILAYDKLDNSNSRCGINYIEMFKGEDRVFSQKVEAVDFGKTRDIFTVMDYKTLVREGDRFNKLFIDDGNRLSEFYTVVNKGIISVINEDVPLRVQLKDLADNTSTVKFSLRPDLPTLEAKNLLSLLHPIVYDLVDNTLVIQRIPCENPLSIYSKGQLLAPSVSYANSKREVYLIDLRKVLPDSALTCNGSKVFHYKDRIPPATYTYYGDWTELSFQSRSLYDTMYLQLDRMEYDDHEVFSIGTDETPANSSVKVLLSPAKSYNESRSSVYKINRNRYEYIGGDWKNGKIEFRIREFGDFTIRQDTIPPSIRKIHLTNYSARFRISDNLSGIAYIEANVNGKWLLMNYDPKFHVIWSERLSKTDSFSGDFILKIVDRAGNESIFTQKI